MTNFRLPYFLNTYLDLLDSDKILGFIGLMSRVFTNGLGDWVSIPGRVIPKTQKVVVDVALLNPQQYKVRIKGKVKQSKERSSTLPYISQGRVLVAIEKGAFGSPSTKVVKFTYYIFSILAFM